MKFKILEQELKEELAAVSVARARFGDSEALRGVLFEVEGGKLRLTASNPEYSITRTVDLGAGYHNDGAFVAGGDVIEIVKKLNDGYVDFELDGATTLIIKSGKFSCVQTVLTADKYFKRDLGGKPTGVQRINGGEICSMVNSVVYACAELGHGDDEIRTGVRLLAENGKITATALDGHRVAIAEGKYSGDDIDIVLSGKMLKETLGIFEGETEVEVVQYHHMFVLKTEESVITVSELAGQYPNVNRILPCESAGQFRATRGEMLKAVERLRVVDKTRVMVFEISDGRLELSVGSGKSAASEEIDVEAIGDLQDMIIGLSTGFLADALRAMDDGEIIVSYLNPLKPVTLINADADRRHYIFPVRLRRNA